MASIGASPNFFVVCLGGSTGALHAYLDILKRVGTDSGMAFVVVSHRGPSQAHLLSQILSSATEMAVIDVEDGTRVVPDCVFVAPPGVAMTFDGGLLHVAPTRAARGWPTNISDFLLSAAQTAGRRTIAVILSGKDFDGSSALQTVAAAGGTNIAQANAVSPDMPAASLATGWVNYYLPSSEIADRLLKIARRSC